LAFLSFIVHCHSFCFGPFAPSSTSDLSSLLCCVCCRDWLDCVQQKLEVGFPFSSLCIVVSPMVWKNGRSHAPEDCFCLVSHKGFNFHASLFKILENTRLFMWLGSVGFLGLCCFLFLCLFFLASPWQILLLLLNKIIQRSCCWWNCYNGECSWGGTLCCAAFGDGVFDSEHCKWSTKVYSLELWFRFFCECGW